MKAGTAKTAITPPGDTPRVKAVGGQPTRAREGELFARALVLDDGATRYAIVTYDLNCLDVATPILRARCMRELGISPACLVLLATHNHLAPIQIAHENYDYGRWLAEELFALIQRAIDNLRGPAHLFFGCDRAYFLQSNGSAPVDFEVQLLKATVGRSAIAMLFNHATHPARHTNDCYNASHPGYALEELEARYPGATPMYADACGGNQYILWPGAMPLGTREKIKSLPHNSLAECRSLGHILAEAAGRICDSEMQEVTGPISSGMHVLSLPLAPPIPYEEAARLAEGIPRDIGYVPFPRKERGTNWIRAVLRFYENGIPFPKRSDELVCTDDGFMLEKLDEPREFECRYEEAIVSKIGPMAFVALQGEVCAPIGMRIKDAFRAVMPLMLTAYMGEHNMYIPTRELIRIGAYQSRAITEQYACPCGWAPEVEDEMVTEVTRLAREIG